MALPVVIDSETATKCKQVEGLLLGVLHESSLGKLTLETVRESCTLHHSAHEYKRASKGDRHTPNLLDRFVNIIIVRTPLR